MNQDLMKFHTLYGIVNDEIEAGTTNAGKSATNALLWLKRYGVNTNKNDRNLFYF
jgi:hypothetical protein